MVCIFLAILGVCWTIRLEKHSRKLLKLRKCGTIARCEIVSVEETKLKNSVSYVHTVRFMHDGQEVTAEDNNGYAEKYPEDASPEIVYDSSNPQEFVFRAQLQRLIKINCLFEVTVMIVTAVCAIMSLTQLG